MKIPRYCRPNSSEDRRPKSKDLVLVTPATLNARVLSPALLLIKLLVKLDSPPSNKESRKNSQGTSKKQKSTSHAVERLLASGIEVGAEPVADLADAVGDGDKSGLLSTRSGNNSCFPRELQVETVVSTADEKDDTDVACCHVDRADEDTATGGGENDGDDNVVCRFHEVTARPSDETGSDVSKSVGRSLDEVGGHLVEAEGVHDRRKEILEALGSDEGEVHETEVPGEGIANSILDTIPGSTDLLLNTTVGNQDSVLSHLAFLLSEELGVIGPRGKNEEGNDSDEDGDDTLNEEEPLPSVHTSDTIHMLQNTSGQETRDDVGDSVTSVPNSHAERTFFLGIPRRCHESQTGEERRFHQTDKETNNTETSTVGHGGHADCSGAPHEHDGGEEDLGICPGHDKIAGELTDEITDVEGRDTGVPDSIGHAEIFLKTGETSVGDVDAIEVAAKGAWLVIDSQWGLGSVELTS